MTPTFTDPPSTEPRRPKRPTPGGPVQRYLAEDLTGEASPDEAAARAAGMLPAELLQPGEVIILLLKPSAWFILLAPLRTVLLLLILTLAAVALNGRFGLGYSNQNLAAAGVVLVLIRLFWQFLEWLSRVYVLTDRRIISVSGVIRVLVFETTLENIQHTQTLFSLRERLFALGTISFATAGTAVSETYWLMLSSPLEVHQKIVQTLHRYRR